MGAVVVAVRVVAPGLPHAKGGQQRAGEAATDLPQRATSRQSTGQQFREFIETVFHKNLLRERKSTRIIQRSRAGTAISGAHGRPSGSTSSRSGSTEVQPVTDPSPRVTLLSEPGTANAFRRTP